MNATEREVHVGGWGWAIVFFGWIGGLIGYFSLRTDDPRRANHVMKWGLIWTLISIVIWGGLLIGFIALVTATGSDSEITDVSSGFDGTTAPPTDTDATTPGAGSAAGKPCVAVADPLPAGAPDVPVVVGPPPTELVSQDVTVGTGATVEASSTITVDYIGVSCSTGKIFDASYGQQPATFALSGVIPGWQQGLPGMKVGGTRLLGIPADLAYGAQGYPPDIAPDETLWFVVQVRDLATTG